jgi:hypothetical protein
MNYQNNQQEFGQGLYITPLEDVSNWYKNLSGREYAVPIDISSLNIINEEDFPSMGKMAKDLMAAGFTADDIDALKPKGDTFNRNVVNLVTKREWAKLKGYDAVRPHIDGKEGEQIIILNPSNVNLGEPIPIDEVIRKTYK